jgi:trehalose 6-phosphate synthase/phosphatase
MDSMHPDPDPVPPPSLSELRAQVSRLEAAHKAKGLPLSGRIIHLCHHLPVEIVRIITPTGPSDGGGGGPNMGVLSPPMTPEFKPEDADTTTESIDSKWKIHGRRGHTAMVSGMRSLSESHEQLVVAWTGDVLLQPSTASGSDESLKTPSGPRAAAARQAVPAQAYANNGDLSPAAPALAPMAKDESPLMVYGGEFNDGEKAEIQSELARFSDVEAERESGRKLTYVPVFVSPEVSKGHYEGYCKTSECSSIT